MPDQKITLKCYHPDCATDPPLEIIVETSNALSGFEVQKQKAVYCERNHLNIINLPASWDRQNLVLGDDIIGYHHNLPIFQGRRP